MPLSGHCSIAQCRKRARSARAEYAQAAPYRTCAISVISGAARPLCRANSPDGQPRACAAILMAPDSSVERAIRCVRSCAWKREVKIQYVALERTETRGRRPAVRAAPLANTSALLKSLHVEPARHTASAPIRDCASVRSNATKDKLRALPAAPMFGTNVQVVASKMRNATRTLPAVLRLDALYELLPRTIAETTRPSTSSDR